MTRVKICGLREAEHVEAAVTAGADLIGFILYPAVRRYVEPGVVRDLLAGIERQRTLAVGVFVDEEPERVNEIAAYCGLDLVQLSGHESPDVCARMTRPTMKTLHVGESLDSGQVAAYATVVDYLHLDAARPGRYGGTGQSFDWRALASVVMPRPVLLAGGLTADNVAEAITLARPWAVDVSSGVEIDGRKDSARISAFVVAARRVEAARALGTRAGAATEEDGLP